MDIINKFKIYLLQGRNKHSKITVKNYLSDVRKFINWFEKSFSREFESWLITPQIIDSYKQHLLRGEDNQKVFSASSLKRYISSLKKFYFFLISEGIAQKNPFETEIKKDQAEADIWKLKMFSNYLELTNASRTTIKNYVLDINKFKTWVENITTPQDVSQGFLGPKKISNQLIEEYKARLFYDAGFSAASINRMLSSLRKYIYWLKNENLITRDIVFDQLPSLSKDIEVSQNVYAERPQPISESKNEFIYSSLPPLRMTQKLINFSGFAFDLLFLLPLVKIISSIRHTWWKLTGRKVFSTTLDQTISQQNKVSPGSIKSLPKSFYAPLKMSVGALPLHRRIIYHLRHTRPLWYRKYHSYRVVHYFHFGILLVYTAFLGFKIYDGLLSSPRMQPEILGSQQSVARFLSFKGRLADSANNPITKQSSLRFSLYDDKIASGSSLLWQETQLIEPDKEGNFQTLLGQKQPLTQQFLNDNPLLFLGIVIGRNDELKPRQQIATVAYTKDSEKLQGMSPITDPNAGTGNIILALDSSGNLTIGGHAAPRFEVTEGEFTLSGQTLTLTTAIDSNTNIQLNPDGTGIIDLQKPIQNTTNYSIAPETEGMVQVADSLGIIAQSATQSALLVSQNSTGNLLSALNNGVAKFTVDYLGNGIFAESVAINGNNLTSDRYTFNLLNKNVVNLNIGSQASQISLGASSGATMINNRLIARGLITAGSGITIPPNQKLTFEDGVVGAIPFLGAGKEIAYDVSNLSWDNTNRRLGIGIATPSYKLEIQDNQAATAAAQIYNANTEADAGALILKLGVGTASTTNKFLSFQTAAGEISSITGDGSNGIQIRKPADFGDWAEYIPKDPDEEITFGSLVCIKQNGKATACDMTENKIIGIASEHPTVIAGKDLGYGSVAVGITGIVKTFVSSQNGDIKPGDLITYSETPGIGIKATQKGMVVGRALEQYVNSNASQIGSVLIVLQTSWYDPQTELTQSGDLISQPPSPQSPISPLLSNLVDNITTGLIEAKNISTQSLSVATDNITIGSKTLKEYIGSIVEEKLKANPPSMLAQSLQTDSFELATQSASQISPTPPISQIASDSAAASSSANLLSASTASASALAPSINPNLLNSPDLPHLPDLNPDFSRFEQGILALGASSLTDVSIDGSLYLGKGTVFSENSINTLGASLELQPLRQGNLSIMGELVTIDTEGNLNVKGVLSAHIISPVPDSDLIVKLPTTNYQLPTKFVIHNSIDQEVLSISDLGNLIASGTGTFKNIATESLTIIRSAQADTSFTETIASASAGTAMITAYETERTIRTPFVKKDSLIYISPISATQNQNLYVARQIPEGKNSKGSFTVQISKSITKNIEFNWFIVN